MSVPPKPRPIQNPLPKPAPKVVETPAVKETISAPKPVKPATATVNRQPAPTPEYAKNLLFGKENYTLMFAGVALIIIGFFLMSGGKSNDPHGFNYDEIYSFRRITLAPIVLLTGFAVQIFAIMRIPKQSAEQQIA